MNRKGAESNCNQDGPSQTNGQASAINDATIAKMLADLEAKVDSNFYEFDQFNAKLMQLKTREEKLILELECQNQILDKTIEKIKRQKKATVDTLDEMEPAQRTTIKQPNEQTAETSEDTIKDITKD